MEADWSTPQSRAGGQLQGLDLGWIWTWVGSGSGLGHSTHRPDVNRLEGSGLSPFMFRIIRTIRCLVCQLGLELSQHVFLSDLGLTDQQLIG